MKKRILESQMKIKFNLVRSLTNSQDKNVEKYRRLSLIFVLCFSIEGNVTDEVQFISKQKHAKK